MVELNPACKVQKDITEIENYYLSYADFASFSHTDAVILHKGTPKTENIIYQWKQAGISWHSYCDLKGIESANIRKFDFAEYFVYNYGMTVGLVMPTRMEKDRLPLIKYAKEQMEKQTLEPHLIEMVDFEGETGVKDITKRYRIGFTTLAQKNASIIFAWEDDDYYNPNYLNLMLTEWIKDGKKDLLGISQSIYYNIKNQKYLSFNHAGTSSMFCTAIRGSAIRQGRIKWCDDDYSYLDWHLWKRHAGTLVSFENYIAVGIKHGFGLCGGGGHKMEWRKFNGQDEDYKLLAKLTDKPSLSLYKALTK